MLLLVRFLITALKGLFRSQIGPLDPSVVRFTALPFDCDLNFHLNAGRFISFMDVARVDLLGRTRVLRPMLRMGWRPVMGGTAVRFRRSILPFERFTVQTRVLGWDEKWFYFEQIVYRRDGSLAAIGTMRMLLRKKDGNVSPRELLALMHVGELPSPALPTFVEQWRRAEDER